MPAAVPTLPHSYRVSAGGGREVEGSSAAADRFQAGRSQIETAPYLERRKSLTGFQTGEGLFIKVIAKGIGLLTPGVDHHRLKGLA